MSDTSAEGIARLLFMIPTASLLVSSLFKDLAEALLRSDPPTFRVVTGTGGASTATLPARERLLDDEGVVGREGGREFVGVAGRDRGFMIGSEKPELSIVGVLSTVGVLSLSSTNILDAVEVLRSLARAAAPLSPGSPSIVAASRPSVDAAALE